ncbi:unnamed protein product [Vitrella brassicaformis CCMP3155]|uniref:Transmembrane protein n=2 Tax=Vitrella brassicaformis TaxID=1169539 RepID=A0A0G4GZU8_VITBC|nr:unnamed protein product [Vitrella brassicaformis CCMP3155]|mmetsp:Transcript_33450/g.96647  ORF Transcript_33450/g.96647 Transcript_33450/m.96647 type:complete len:636 (-) Transcript_33450:276-2183(-)|eukprot:CEM36613.1 unnamed protein product [Vitrella brassicaformis CCMP3155]
MAGSSSSSFRFPHIFRDVFPIDLWTFPFLLGMALSKFANMGDMFILGLWHAPCAAFTHKRMANIHLNEKRRSRAARQQPQNRPLEPSRTFETVSAADEGWDRMKLAKVYECYGYDLSHFPWTSLRTHFNTTLILVSTSVMASVIMFVKWAVQGHRTHSWFVPMHSFTAILIALSHLSWVTMQKLKRTYLFCFLLILCTLMASLFCWAILVGVEQEPQLSPWFDYTIQPGIQELKNRWVATMRPFNLGTSVTLGVWLLQGEMLLIFISSFLVVFAVAAAFNAYYETTLLELYHADPMRGLCQREVADLVDSRSPSSMCTWLSYTLPLLCPLMWVKPMARDIIVGQGWMGGCGFELARLSLVVLLVVCKLSHTPALVQLWLLKYLEDKGILEENDNPIRTNNSTTAASLANPAQEAEKRNSLQLLHFRVVEQAFIPFILLLLTCVAATNTVWEACDLSRPLSRLSTHALPHLTKPIDLESLCAVHRNTETAQRMEEKRMCRRRTLIEDLLCEDDQQIGSSSQSAEGHRRLMALYSTKTPTRDFQAPPRGGRLHQLVGWLTGLEVPLRQGQGADTDRDDVLRNFFSVYSGVREFERELSALYPREFFADVCQALLFGSLFFYGAVTLFIIIWGRSQQT